MQHPVIYRPALRHGSVSTGWSWHKRPPGTVQYAGNRARAARPLSCRQARKVSTVPRLDDVAALAGAELALQHQPRRRQAPRRTRARRLRRHPRRRAATGAPQTPRSAACVPRRGVEHRLCCQLEKVQQTPQAAIRRARGTTATRAAYPATLRLYDLVRNCFNTVYRSQIPDMLP